jgi:hypothetical protein
MYKSSAKRNQPREHDDGGRILDHDGVLRQTKTHHLQAIPLLTASGAGDVVRVPTVIRVTVDAGGAVHSPEVSEERRENSVFFITFGSF